MDPRPRKEVTTMDDELREQVALFRHGVVGELVSGTLAPGDKEKTILRLASKSYEIPGTTRTTLGRSTIRDWVALYEAMGFEGLKPVPRSDVGTCRTIPEPVQDLLLALAKEKPKVGVPSLIRTARLSGKVPADVRLPESTIYRLLEAHGVPRRHSTSTSEPDAMAFAHPYVNDLWMADVMHGPRLLVPGRRQGVKTYLHAFIDDASRVVPYAAFYLAENAACCVDAFKQALLRRGVARRLYCDQGATYRTHHLQVICATLNIALIHSRPHRPRGRGKIERWFRTVRSSFLAHVTSEMLVDLASLNRLLWAWVESEYHRSPHRGLDGNTPLDRFMEDQSLVHPAPDDLEALMRMKVGRRVYKDRTVRLEGRLYEAPDGYAEETVEVLYDPYDPTRPVHLRRPGETDEVALRLLDPHANASVRRQPRDSDEPEAPPATGISYLELVAQRFYEGEEE